MIKSIILFGVLFAAVQAYSINQQCSEDSDCAASEVFCSKANYDPSCAKGICACKQDYKYVVDACVTIVSKNLDDACNITDTRESYPYQAKCESSKVVCNTPTYTKSGSACVPATMASFNGTCEVAPSSLAVTCNATAGMVCSSSTLRCECSAGANTYYQSSTSRCTLRTFGDSCTTVQQCDTGTFTNLLAAGGGPACTNSKCACATNFTQVSRLDLQNGATTTVTLCLKGHSADIAMNKTCTLRPETQSVTGAQVCGTSYACLRCPEDTYTATNGICREFISSSSRSMHAVNGIMMMLMSAVLYYAF